MENDIAAASLASRLSECQNFDAAISLVKLHNFLISQGNE